MKQNPWLGLATYDEQAVAQGYKFCGRERAIKELYSIIDNNLLTTLYGKSGIGKSSLLQAGVFPCLRNDNYLPIMIRLGIETTAEKDYASLIIEAIHNAIKKIGGQCVKTRESKSTREEERLWDFFHTTEFRDRNEEYLFPVIVLDQFEELYYKDKQQLNLLLKSLYLLVDDNSLPTTNDDDPTNYRLVLSIREDDLFHLEDSIDKLRLVEMKYNRYRLRELTDDEARDVIMRPGVALLNPAESSVIADSIIKEAKAGSEEISTAVLSLICSRIYYISQSVQSTAGTSQHITLSQVTSFFKQAEGNFLKSFYDDIIKELKSPDKWYYIEDTLVTDEGRRNSVLKSEFDKAVPNNDFLFKGEKSMLRCITVAGSDIPRVEIIHDMLARQMMSSRNERKLKQQAAALRKQRMTAVAIILLALVLGGVFYAQYRSIVAERNGMLKMRSHYITERALSAFKEGNAGLAARLLLSIAPDSSNKKNKNPYIARHEHALRTTFSHFDDASKVLIHQGAVNSAKFSPDGKFIVSASEDNTVKIWDVTTGNLVRTIEQKDGAKSAQFTTDGKYILTSSESTFRVWEVKTGKMQRETHYEGHISLFSPGGKYFCASDGEYFNVWDPLTGELINTFEDNRQYYYIPHVRTDQFSPDEKRIFTFRGNDNIMEVRDISTGEVIQTITIMNSYNGQEYTINGRAIWGEDIITWFCTYTISAYKGGEFKIQDVKTGELKKTIPYPLEDYFYDLHFVPDGKHVITEKSNDCKVWDINTRLQVGELRHAGRINTIESSRDGKYIATASDDCTVKIWELGKYNEHVTKHNGRVQSVNFSPDGKSAIIITDSAHLLWDIDNDSEYMLKENDGYVSLAQFSSDGKYVVLLSDSVHFFDKETKKCIYNISGGNYRYGAKVSPHCNYLLHYQDNIMGIYDVKLGEIGKLKRKEIKHKSPIKELLLSPDDKYVITALADSTISVWNLESGLQKGKTLKMKEPIDRIFCTDSNTIVVASTNIVQRWDIEDDEQVLDTLVCEKRKCSFHLSLSGKYILAYSYHNHTFNLWDTETKKLIWENTEAYYGKHIKIDISPADNYFIVKYSPNDIWNLKTGVKIKTMEGDGYNRSSCQFTPDGHSVLVYNVDKTSSTMTIEKIAPYQEIINRYKEKCSNWALSEEELIEYNFK